MKTLKVCAEVMWLCFLPFRLIFRVLPPMMRLVIIIAGIAMLGAAPLMCSSPTGHTRVPHTSLRPASQAVAAARHHGHTHGRASPTLATASA